ncbi:hypothetical protein AVL62_16015 [Serinicoccus chungangensis]|uniref:Uncharacterized protein n=1 Tax=Serinicoccus chungangensis TaxID=767452 RepID=A0A0W8ICE3_9MICO|nr:hypothetical protein AVL62_16015 [Serinicoccus chungangensis]
MAIACSEVVPSVRPARPRVAVVTVVRGEHRALLAQVDGLSTSTWPPDVHVTLAVADRELNRNKLPIRSDRWETFIVPGRDLRRAPRAAFRSSVMHACDVALNAGAEVVVFVDVRCLPGRRLLQTYAEHATNSTQTTPVLWSAAQTVQLDVPPGTVYPVSGGLGSLVTPTPVDARPSPTTGPSVPWAESFAVRAGDWAVVRKAWAGRKSPAEEQPTMTSSSREPQPVPSLVDAVRSVGGSHVQVPDDAVLYRQHPRFADTRYSPGALRLPESTLSERCERIAVAGS